MPLFTILTLFPDALEPYLHCGVIGSALKKGLADVRLVDFRDWTRDRYRSVDDRPFGGGPGMVLRPEPVVECVEWVEEQWGPHRRLATCPSGRPFRQRDAQDFSSSERTLILCGRYEGFDERIFQVLDFELISIGDFVLTGGELPALCVIDASVRLLPGALGNESSAPTDSFQEEGQLDHPHYTRPRSYRGLEVPPVLLQGDHGGIEQWRKSEADKRTKIWRKHSAPDDN